MVVVPSLMTRFFSFILASFVCLTPLFSMSPVDRMRLSDNGVIADAPIYKLDGTKVRLSDFRGKYVLMTFWATWCRACVSEMPYLEKLAQQFKHDDIEFITITRSYPSQTKDTINNYRRTNKLDTLEFFEDSNGKETQAQVHSNFHVTSLPSAVLIDPNGRYIGRLDGAVQWNHRDLVKFFQDLLDGKVKPSAQSADSGSWLDSIKSWFS